MEPRANTPEDYGMKSEDPRDSKAIVVKMIAKDKRFVPSYKTYDAAGFDIRFFMAEGIPGQGPASDLPFIWINPGETAILHTGLFVEIPSGYEIQIRPRSGLSTKGLIVTNSPGTIDADYRGEIMIIMTNTSKDRIEIHHQERIAQGVLAPVIHAHFELVDKLGDTDRGAGGLGSTGRI